MLDKSWTKNRDAPRSENGAVTGQNRRMQTEKTTAQKLKGIKAAPFEIQNGIPAEKKLPGTGLLSIPKKRKYRHMIGTEKKQEPR